MKFSILDNLCKIETILYEIYDDECSCNEGSLTDKNLNDIIYIINRIRYYLEDLDEKY